MQSKRTKDIQCDTTVPIAHSEVLKVEKQLSKKCKTISEIDSKVSMFKKMVKHSVPTKDVDSFVRKQSNQTRTNIPPCKKTIKGKSNELVKTLIEGKAYLALVTLWGRVNTLHTT